MHVFTIDSDIRKAETIPSAFYTDDTYFQESREKIFARTWQLVSTLDEVKNVKPYVLLENFLDEEILLTRDAEETLACMSNVCTHRGKILVERECRLDGIRCRYHGRRFSLNGRFLSMPEFEAVENFPTDRDDLAKVPFETWKKFIFVSPNPVAPLGEFVSNMEAIKRDFGFKDLKFVGAKDYEINAHWALYCENYLEGFHIPFVHKSLNDELDYGKYATETFRYSSLQTGIEETGEIAAQYFFIFPNLMFNFYSWGLSINIVKPVKKDFTRVSYLTFVSDESKAESGAGADLETVEFEDQAVVESVQRGVRSRYYDRGRYSPTREAGTHHFHRLIAEFMN